MRTVWPDHINLAVIWSNFNVYIFNKASIASLLNDAPDRVGLFSCKCCICMPKSRRLAMVTVNSLDLGGCAEDVAYS